MDSLLMDVLRYALNEAIENGAEKIESGLGFYLRWDREWVQRVQESTNEQALRGCVE